MNKKCYKQRISMILTALLIVFSMAFAYMSTMSQFNVFAADETSGQCGDNLTWSLDKNTGVMTISGSGKMWDQSTFWSLSNKSYIKSIEFNGSITSIGGAVFQDCNNLKEVTIPDTVTVIGNSAFADCSALSSVKLGNLLVTLGGSSFYGCRNLTNINIPNSVTIIESRAFQECSGLSKVIIGDSVTEIGVFAFSGCKKLKDLVIGNSLSIIGQDAFSGCTNLKKVKLPNSVVTIDTYSFSNCISMEKIYVPVSVKSIDYCVFNNCKSLSDVYYSGSKSDWNKIDLSDYENEYFINAIIHYNSTVEDFENSKTISITETTTNTTTNTKADTSTTTPTKADETLKPLTLKLTNELVKNNELAVTNIKVHYKVSATITNNNSIEVNNAVAKISLPEKFELNKGEKTQILIGPMSPSSSKTVDWEIVGPLFEKNTTVTYDVTAVADKLASITQSDTIYIESDLSNNNYILDLSKDVWNFAQCAGDKVNTKKLCDTYYINDDDLNALLYGLSNKEKDEIKELVGTQSGGWCYGMSVMVALSKVNVLKASELQSGKKNLYSISKKPKDSVESKITYYWLTCQIDLFDSICEKFLDKSYYNLPDTASNRELASEQLKKISDMLNGTSNNGTPVVLSFFWYDVNENGEFLDKNGNVYNGDLSGQFTDDDSSDLGIGCHAIVLYAEESGSWKFDGPTTFDRRFKTYDPNVEYNKKNNYSDERSCLYYDSKTGKWTIPVYQTGIYELWSIGKIQYATNKLSEIDLKNYATSYKNRNAYLKAEKATKFKIYDSSNKRYSIFSITDQSELTAWPSDCGYIEGQSTSGITVALPYANSKYSIKPDNESSEIDYTLQYPNYSVSLNASNAKSCMFDENGAVSVKSDDADCTLSIVANEGYYNSSWYKVEVSGKTIDSAQLKITDDGYVVSGDNLKNVTVTVSNDKDKQSITAYTDKNSMLITESSDENGKLTVLVDSDGDGTYDAPFDKAEVNAEFFVFDKETLSLKQGETSEIMAVVLPLNFNKSSIIWKSSNEKVAVVDENGVVTGIGEGKATITAVTLNKKSASCEATVSSERFTQKINYDSSNTASMSMPFIILMYSTLILGYLLLIYGGFKKFGFK